MEISKEIHQGRGVKAFRELRNLNQRGLGIMIGVHQKAIHNIERKEIVKPYYLDQLAKALDVPVGAIANYNEVDAIAALVDKFNTNV